MSPFGIYRRGVELFLLSCHFSRVAGGGGGVLLSAFCLLVLHYFILSGLFYQKRLVKMYSVFLFVKFGLLMTFIVLCSHLFIHFRFLSGVGWQRSSFSVLATSSFLCYCVYEVCSPVPPLPEERNCQHSPVIFYTSLLLISSTRMYRSPI